MIERMAEEFEYCELLHQASACEDLTRQMVYVVAFVVSSIAPTVGRTTKPFNPLLGTPRTASATSSNLPFVTRPNTRTTPEQ